MTTDDLQLRQLKLDGVKILVGWAKAEGWNPGPYDAEAFFAADPEGFYGFYQGDELIGGGSLVSYGGEFGFMGLFIMKPEYRSQGIGRNLWYQRRDTLLSRLNPGASIGMDGVIAMQPFYAKGGFSIAFRDERYEIAGGAYEIAPEIARVSDEDMEALIAYDRKRFIYPRENFLRYWLKMPESSSFKYEKDGAIKGYATVRKVDEGYKIGPLFAEDADVAEALLKACLQTDTHGKFYLDIPVTNEQAVALVKRYDGQYFAECARMYYGKAPQMDINKVFSITTFELG